MKLTKKQKFPSIKKSYYSNLLLIDEEGNEYSANPGDYWNVPENKKFMNHYLVVKEHKNGWNRTKIVKKNPTVKDMIKWNKKTKIY